MEVSGKIAISCLYSQDNNGDPNKDYRQKHRRVLHAMAIVPLDKLTPQLYVTLLLQKQMPAIAEIRPEHPVDSPINEAALSYLRDLIPAMSTPDLAVFNLSDGRKIAVCTATFRETVGGYNVLPGNQWENEAMFILICAQGADPRQVAIARSGLTTDCDARIYLSPAVSITGSGGSVTSRGKETIEVPLVGTVSGTHDSPLNLKEYPYLAASLYLSPEEAERVGNTLVAMIEEIRKSTASVTASPTPQG